MLEPNIKSELALKAILVDWLLVSDPKAVIACEVPFADKRRRADVVQIKDDELHAYEIKSAFDNLDKLELQLKDYAVGFDYLSVACEEKYLAAVLRKTPKTIGVLLFKTNKTVYIRKPSKRKKLTKKMLLSFLGKQTLNKAASHHGLPKLLNNNINSLRNHLCNKLSLDEAHQLAVTSLLLNHTSTFNMFLHEKSAQTNIEDIQLLSGSLNKLRGS